MSQYLRPNIRAMAGYTPGEQPQVDGIVKLNTNENPYPPSPRVIAAIGELLRGDRLRKYPDPSGAAFRRTRHPTQSETFAGWDDNRVLLQVASTRVLGKQSQLFLRYDHESNDSPVAGFDYGRNRIGASVEFWY